MQLKIHFISLIKSHSKLLTYLWVTIMYIHIGKVSLEIMLFKGVRKLYLLKVKCIKSLLQSRYINMNRTFLYYYILLANDYINLFNNVLHGCTI